MTWILQTTLPCCLASPFIGIQSQAQVTSLAEAAKDIGLIIRVCKSTWQQTVVPSHHYKSMVNPTTIWQISTILAPKWHLLQVTLSLVFWRGLLQQFLPPVLKNTQTRSKIASRTFKFMHFPHFSENKSTTSPEGMGSFQSLEVGGGSVPLV